MIERRRGLRDKLQNEKVEGAEAGPRQTHLPPPPGEEQL